MTELISPQPKYSDESRLDQSMRDPRVRIELSGRTYGSWEYFKSPNSAETSLARNKGLLYHDLMRRGLAIIPESMPHDQVSDTERRDLQHVLFDKDVSFEAIDRLIEGFMASELAQEEMSSGEVMDLVDAILEEGDFAEIIACLDQKMN